MDPIRFQVRSFPPRDVVDDDALGEQLVDLTLRAVARGSAPPVVACVRERRVDLFPAVEVVRAGFSPNWFAATLTRATPDDDGPVLAVGLLGTHQMRRRGEQEGVPIALVFLEWADCRWWSWRALVTADGRGLRDGSELRGRARDGVAKPARLGGWWSRGRRLNVTTHLDRTEGLVH